jgi:hypothetical protein
MLTMMDAAPFHPRDINISLGHLEGRFALPVHDPIARRRSHSSLEKLSQLSRDGTAPVSAEANFVAHADVNRHEPYRCAWASPNKHANGDVVFGS